MAKTSLLISWSNSEELFGFDLAKLQKDDAVATQEVWDDGERVDYVAQCRRCERSSVGYEVELHYERAAHERLIDPLLLDVIEWGTTTLNVALDRRNATVSYKPVSGRGFDGKCSVLDAGQRRRAERKFVNAASRAEQGPFRDRLRKFDQECAVTGERTWELLDAAHIVAQADDGVAHLGNGLLLRADLHRLLDSRSGNRMEISARGIVRMRGSLAAHEAYKHLDGKKIRQKVFDRIEQALIAAERKRRS